MNADAKQPMLKKLFGCKTNDVLVHFIQTQLEESYHDLGGFEHAEYESWFWDALPQNLKDDIGESTASLERIHLVSEVIVVPICSSLKSNLGDARVNLHSSLF